MNRNACLGAWGFEDIYHGEVILHLFQESA